MLQNGIAGKVFAQIPKPKDPPECREGLKLGAGAGFEPAIPRPRDYEPEFAFREQAGDAVKPISAFLLFK